MQPFLETNVTLLNFRVPLTPCLNKLSLGIIDLPKQAMAPHNENVEMDPIKKWEEMIVRKSCSTDELNCEITRAVGKSVFSCSKNRCWMIAEALMRVSENSIEVAYLFVNFLSSVRGGEREISRMV